MELLVVISIIGLITGVIAPRFINIGDKLVLKNQQLEIRQKINGLPFLATRSTNRLQIDRQGAPIELPENWRVTADKPVVYQSNGSCLGGEIQLWSGSTLVQRANLQAPFCQWQL